MTEAFDPVGAIRILNRHGVRFVIIGGVAAGLWGSPAITRDLDICYQRSPENHEALVRALRELGATLRGAPAGLPFILDARTITMGDCFTFTTTAGSFDCLGTPAGTHGYEELVKNAREVEVDTDVRVRIAAIEDLMRMKRAAAREKDLRDLSILATLKEERERGS